MSRDVSPGQAKPRASRVMVALLFFYALIAPSPIWPAIGIRGFALLALVLGVLLAYFLLTRRKVNVRLLAFAGIPFVLAVVPAVYWSLPALAIYPIFFVAGAILVSQSTPAERSGFVSLSSGFMVVMLVGAVIGYLIAAAGLAPLTIFDNTDGRTNYVFYTTFTNTLVGGFIRPSGIYDEPGALSFFVCAVAYLREATGRSRPMTFALMLLGFITFSVMHLIFFVIFIIALGGNLRKILKFVLGFALFVAALFAVGAGPVIQDRILSRLEVNEDGNIAGDTRSVLVLNAALVLMDVDHAALMGADSDCSFDTESCIAKFGLMGENLLSPLVDQGLFISWPYYLFLLFGLTALRRGRRGLLFFAVALLFVQRPYLLNLGYTVFGSMAFLLNSHPAPVGRQRLTTENSARVHVPSQVA